MKLVIINNLSGLPGIRVIGPFDDVFEAGEYLEKNGFYKEPGFDGFSRKKDSLCFARISEPDKPN